jgi:hypothetical protein
VRCQRCIGRERGGYATKRCSGGCPRNGSWLSAHSGSNKVVLWHDTLDICPHGAEFFQSGPGLAFLHRLVMAFHLVCVEVGACGIRLVCLLLTLTGLDRFVAASYGAQQQVNRRVEEAMGAYRQDETARLAKDMPRKDLTVTQDETLTGGLCLVTMDPDSNFIILEQLAQARDQGMWNALMAPALAQLNCQVIQSTSDEAPGLLAYVEHYLEAHHSPDLFHVQHELSKAVSAPMATKERAAHKVVGEAREQLEQSQAHQQSAGDEPEKRGPGRPPKAPVSLEEAEQVFEAASREHERLTVWSKNLNTAFPKSLRLCHRPRGCDPSSSTPALVF